MVKVQSIAFFCALTTPVMEQTAKSGDIHNSLMLQITYLSKTKFKHT